LPGNALRFGQRVKLIEHRGAQLVEAGEGPLHLRLHAADSRDTEVRRLIGNIVQQRCLADAGLTADDERALSPARTVSTNRPNWSRSAPRRFKADALRRAIKPRTLSAISRD
jgi:hypothetical protein